MKKINKALIGGSILLMITYNLFNALNFFYHFAMARLLSIIEYGILATLFSVVYILSILAESVQTIITKYTSKESNFGKLKDFLIKSLKQTSKLSMVLFVFYLLISIPLAYLLNISYGLLALNGILIFAALTTPITRGIMQGRKMFKSLGFNMVIESGTKFVLAVILVLLGLGVAGAVSANIIGPIVAFLFSFLFIRKIVLSKRIESKVSDLHTATKPIFIAIFAVIVFISLDVIMAKIVFPSEVAGYYAIASMLGKIIFFGTEPIAKAMFPYSAEDSSKQKKVSRNVFFNSLTLLIICILVSLVIFFFLPGLVIRIFAGRFIPESQAILFLVGLAMSLIAFTNLVLLYKISTGNTKKFSYFLIPLIAEIALLYYFSSNLMQFSLAFITASALFLWTAVFLSNK